MILVSSLRSKHEAEQANDGQHFGEAKEAIARKLSANWSTLSQPISVRRNPSPDASTCLNLSKNYVNYKIL